MTVGLRFLPGAFLAIAEVVDDVAVVHLFFRMQFEHGIMYSVV
jgi:hypothetical protein